MIHYNVIEHPSARWTARQIVKAFQLFAIVPEEASFMASEPLRPLFRPKSYLTASAIYREHFQQRRIPVLPLLNTQTTRE